MAKAKNKKVKNSASNAGTSRYKAFLLCPSLFIILSLSLILSHCFGAEVTGYYGEWFYNYLVEHIGSAACVAGAVALFLSAMRAFSGRSNVKGYVTWSALIMFVCPKSA